MIHPSALISKKSSIGKNVSVGPFAIIHDHVSIEDNVTIDGYCEIGYPTPLAKNNELIIGENSVIRSHTIIYLGSQLKSGLKTGHHVTVRENTQTGIDFQIGSLGDVQGDCIIGDCVRTHSNVHIAKGSHIGNFVWLYPYVVLTNDPHPPSEVRKGVSIEDYAVIATKSTILPGIRIGKHSLVGAHSYVNKNVPPYTLVQGVPIKEICEVQHIPLQDESKQKAYPWPNHFTRGYPKHVIEKWQNNIFD